MNQEKKRKKVFRDFAEYWFHVKSLSEEQRRLIVSSLPVKEQKALRDSYDKGGWADLFMRNACDYQLDYIKSHPKLQLDLLELRMKILSGKPQLIQKSVWRYINSRFDNIPWEHISYIFDGIVAEDYEADMGYVKLSKYIRGS